MSPSSPDPLSRVLFLDARTSGVRAWFWFLSGSLLLTAAVIAGGGVVAWRHGPPAGSAMVVQPATDPVKDAHDAPAAAPLATPVTKAEAQPPDVAPSSPPPPAHVPASRRVVARSSVLDFTHDPAFAMPIGSARISDGAPARRGGAPAPPVNGDANAAGSVSRTR